MLDAYDSGAEDYVVKPFSMKVLLKRVEIIPDEAVRKRSLHAEIWHFSLIKASDFKK